MPQSSASIPLPRTATNNMMVTPMMKNNEPSASSTTSLIRNNPPKPPPLSRSGTQVRIKLAVPCPWKMGNYCLKCDVPLKTSKSVSQKLTNISVLLEQDTLHFGKGGFCDEV